MRVPSLSEHRIAVQRASRGVLIAASLVGLAALVLVMGFPSGSAPWRSGWRLAPPAVGLFAIEYLVSAFLLRRWAGMRMRLWLGGVSLGLLAAGALLVLASGGLPSGPPRPASGLLRVFGLSLLAYLAGAIIFGLARLNRGLARARLRPGAVGFLVFLGLIGTGTGLLLLPNMVSPGRPLAPVDALFTATSAACVTGLTVVDPGTAFTTLGQGVILVLMQLGGLGIMALTAFLALFAGQAFGIRERVMVSDVLNLGIFRQTGGAIAFIVIGSLAIEAVGTVVLYFGFGSHHLGFGARLFESAFHAVSAFCNAGLSTHADSLITYAARPAVVLPIASLLILGGLGFVVLMDLWQAGASRLLPGARGRARGRMPRAGLQTRLVLAMTAALLLGGWVVLLATEWNGALAHLAGHERLIAGFFMAATPRTAGFTVTDAASWAPATVFTLIVLMLIGGSPGSTAGGMKTTTVGVMLAAVRSMARGQERAVIFRRELPERTVREATVVITLYLGALGLCTLLLLITGHHGVKETLFEATSAVGTVGLSLGITPELSTVGKLLVVALMFLGRLGPLTLALAVAGLAPPAAVRYPRERIMIG